MKRRKKSVPIMLFWSKQDQKRFIDAVERFTATAADLAVVAAELRQEHERRRRRRARPAADDNTPIESAQNGRPFGEN